MYLVFILLRLMPAPIELFGINSDAQFEEWNRYIFPIELKI